jgi:ketosteroid isomerase-like protein
MKIDRRHLALPALALGLFAAASAFAPAFALTADEEAVAKKLEAFRAAQMAKDGKALEALILPELSYSHSSALVQDKDEFLKGATDPKSKFLSLEYKDPTIRVVGDAAIVRFHWMAESEMIADGKKSSTNLAILMTWVKQGGDWKLLDRGSTKL